MKNVTLRQLRVFEAVARNLSFSRAADELFLTQPAVSMQVRQLEDLVGLPLFEQVGKKIHLTEAGKALTTYARDVARVLREAEAAFAAMKGMKDGELNIGVVSTAKYFAPNLLARFRVQHPGVRLRLSVDNRETILRLLRDNDIDLAIMGRPPEDPPTVAQVFADHPLVVVAAPDHPLAGRKRVRVEDLVDETFLIREAGSGTRRAMEKFFEDNAIRPQNPLEMSSNETIKQAVMAGMGLGFLSAHTIELELSVGRLVILPVEGTPVLRKWLVVHLQAKRLLPLAEAFREFILTEGARYMKEEMSTTVSRDASVP